MADLQQARVAKARVRERLVGAHGVRGVGLAAHGDDWCVRVNVADDADRSQVPSAVFGVDVEVRVVGRIATAAG